MANMISPCLQLSNPFPLSSSKFSPKTFHIRATEPQTPPSDSDEDFEKRMKELRLRYRSGTGKKAELRKGRKSKKGSGSEVFLAPVPLREPVSDGLKVDFGFSEYSERLNGRIAILGLTALLLVELATGKGVINYHTPSILLIQIYFVASVSALYVKYEKEKISVWPHPHSSSSNK